MSKQRSLTVPLPIVIKEEVESDGEEVHCRLCHKAFASPVALRNHARMDHIETYETGDPSLWTKSENDVKVNKNCTTSTRRHKYTIQKRKLDILSSMAPASITTLADDNVSYIIIKSEHSGLLEEKVKHGRKKEPKKVVLQKKDRTPQAITGPFECLEPSSLGADGSCHQIFFSCCEYSLHLRTEHSRRRRAPRCQVCERPLLAPKDPIAGHPCVCENCGEGFRTEEELAAHASIAHVKLKPYKCEICHKRFTQQGGVAQHMRMHTGDRPFPCTFCAKAFTQKSGLDQHLRTHTKVKPYRCVVCTKSFVQSVHLRQHMRTHTHVAPFACGACGKRFKQSSHLNYHLRHHSPGDAARDATMQNEHVEEGYTEENAETQEENYLEEDQQEEYAEGAEYEEAGDVEEEREVEMETSYMSDVEQVIPEQSMDVHEYIISDTFDHSY